MPIGAAYVFRSLDDGVTWDEMIKLVASDSATEDRFGISVAIYTDLILIGAFMADLSMQNEGKFIIHSFKW